MSEGDEEYGYWAVKPCNMGEPYQHPTAMFFRESDAREWAAMAMKRWPTMCFTVAPVRLTLRIIWQMVAERSGQG